MARTALHWILVVAALSTGCAAELGVDEPALDEGGEALAGPCNCKVDGLFEQYCDADGQRLQRTCVEALDCGGTGLPMPTPVKPWWSETRVMPTLPHGGSTLPPNDAMAKPRFDGRWQVDVIGPCHSGDELDDR